MFFTVPFNQGFKKTTKRITRKICNRYRKNNI